MSFLNCIQTAADVGKIRQEKADEAAAAYQKAYDDGLTLGLGDKAAADQAALRAVEELGVKKAELKHRRVAEMQVMQKLNDRMTMAENLPTEIRTVMDNIETRENTLYGFFHAQVTDFLDQYRPRKVGLVRPVADLDNIIREAYGESTASQSAKEMAEAIASVQEYMRLAANRAGASIPPNPNRRIPQQHDRLKMRRQGRDAWVRDHLEDNVLDWDLMKDRDGGTIAIADRQAVLNRVYDIITTKGYAKIVPGQRTSQSLASRLASERFLYYKNADSWIRMNQKYGAGNLHEQMISSMQVMSRDVALLEFLGPNPDGMKGFMHNLTKLLAATRETPEPTKTKSDVAKIDEALQQFDTRYAIFTHMIPNGEENIVATTLATTRTYLTGTALGAAFLSASGDLFFKKHAAMMYKVPGMTFLRGHLRYMIGANNRKAAIRSGLIAEAATSLALGYTRYFGPMLGSALSRRYTDVVMRASLMTPFTQAGRWAWGMELMAALGDNAGKSFDNMPFRELLEENGLTAADWEIFRKTPLDEHGMLKPIDLYNTAKTNEERELAERFMDMVHESSKRAAPYTGTTEQAFLLGNSAPGTLSGEYLRSAAMFKSFSVSVMFVHMQDIMRKATWRDKIGAAATFFTALTLAGAMIQQLRALSNGKDLYDMNPTNENGVKFWARSMLYGGGLGFVGDFIFSDVNRQNAGLADLAAGPLVEWLNNTRNLTVGNLEEIISGENTNFGREFVRYLARYGPFVSLWQTRTLLKRAVFDALLREADPAAYRRQQMNELRLQNETGQGSWWPTGENLPVRAPKLIKN